MIPTWNYKAANGTTWWVDVNPDGLMEVWSFRGGPKVATFDMDLAPLEQAAIAEMLTVGTEAMAQQAWANWKQRDKEAYGSE